MSRSIKITPETHFLNWQQDPYSNYLARLVFPEKTKSLTIEVDIVAEMINVNPFDFFIEEYGEKYPFSYEKSLEKELVPYFETLPVGPRMKTFLSRISRESVRTIDFIVTLNQLVHNELKYTIRLEAGLQSPEETLTLKSGSCRDFAWLLVQTFRHMGLAARFVSGYSIQLVADVKALDGPSGTAMDCCDLHAWAEVYLPGAGWVGLDATCGLLAGSGYIPLAATAEPANAAPVSGAIMGFDVNPAIADDKLHDVFKHSMSVTRVHEDVRVTKPYTEEQWTEIEKLGHEIDELYSADDVKLTMGGEPTFVSIDHPNDPEWNTTAVGPHKRILAGTLLKRLRERFAPGGFLHYGQGKWYPGESLPRWALGCYWRKDGVPIWTEPELIADEAKNYGVTDTHAHDFIKLLAKRLKVEPEDAIPGYEDAWHYLLQERNYPMNLDPLMFKLDDPEERRRLGNVLDQGLEKIIGYALPLQRRWIDGVVKWVSGPWFLRREHMFLTPGDSPMGFRLPLNSLPWVREEDREMHTELDPFNRYQPLPPRVEFQRTDVPAPFLRGAAPDELRSRGWPTRGTLEKTLRWPKRGSVIAGKSGLIDAPVAYNASCEPASDADIRRLRFDMVRTALCVEPRGGHLYVFLPPQYCLEDYLNLVTAVEDTAREMKLPVLVEGYTPPHDPRIEVMKVTPDPGVIEVNIHPAKNWTELVANTTILYEEARQSRLATEKFMIDGRHTGTGGGNHIVIGGETPAESPLLNRPDVLRSLIAFWHNHPSLSYLFSGMFIGPTSQHPRIDEARNDSVFELELAFKQIPDFGNTPPWLVDRVLRNLLIDASGNTHRTEFCIDKMYSPDSATGRLGLLELRSFEMPPHSRMSLAQQLLLRSLVAKFWEKPYTHHLVRWGTELHDRFMLPYFVEQDFNDVCEDLQESGIAMKAGWFAPHLDFRFPFYGEFTQKGVHFELRQALEPWHVLGEEPGPGGTVRFVDSSVERLQVKVQGMTGSRHVATCNGRRIPLHPTGTNGEFVAGIRYRAWQPSSCLHPTIPVHAPLIIDLLDTWNGRSIGGCMYHVSHPGGRSFETVPVNAYEAESRRVARYFPHGHTPGPMATPACEKTPEFPFTLDLRH